MRRFVVSEDVEIVANGCRMLLESGDVVIVEYIHGPKHNEIRNSTDFDTEEFIIKNIQTLMKGNPNLCVKDIVEAFINEYPDYLLEGDLATQMSPDKIMDILFYSIKKALKKNGLFPNPIYSGTTKHKEKPKKENKEILLPPKITHKSNKRKIRKSIP